MDFYEPTFLFRQNALRRASAPSGHKRQLTNPYLNENFSTLSLWLLDTDMSKDVSLTNKVCSLDRVNIKSNYWKIPDAEMNLTALALSDPHANSPSLAISSANSDNNLFIYELDPFQNFLTHHTTISLPNIHSLCWVKDTNSKFLISGNSKGYAHLISVPSPLADGSDVEESAEIIKRFNHRKYLKLVNKDSSLASHNSTTIPNLGFLCDKLVTTYDDALFVWNLNDVHLSMRPKPESISVVPGITNFDAPITNSSSIALCGNFGVSLFDTRVSQHSIPKSSLEASRDARSIKANLVKWHGTNENILASAHADGRVHLWDIRMNDTFSEISGHRGKSITSMAWNGNDLFTGASDGMIAHWDLTSDLDPTVDLSAHAENLRNCSLKEGMNSVEFDAVRNSVVKSVSERQCGTLLPALNNKIVGMCLISEGSEAGSRCKILLIDGAAFLGLHAKIYDAAGPSNSSSEKKYYSREDIALISQDVSDATLVDPEDKIYGPLTISKSSKAQDFDDRFSAVSLYYGPDKAASLDPYEWSPNLPVVSLHSVDSSSNMHDSPTFSNSSNNDSIFTLSTATTFYEEEAAPKKEFLLHSIDKGLNQIRNEYSMEYCF